MNWHEYFFNLANAVSLKSKDPHTKVGAIIVGPDKEIRSTGYNSFPRGINDNAPERLERPEKYKWIEHAERCAIYNAARSGVSTYQCIMYIPWFPCTDCARAIINSGISEIIIDYRDSNHWKSRKDNWSDDAERSKVMLSEAGVKITKWS